ncbi:MAG: hypothetical protein NXI24_13655 [bacterium]|nr:hypothetical protein [bacterium]
MKRVLYRLALASILCGTLSCITSIDISETEPTSTDSLIIGRVIRLEGWKADQNEPKDWMTFRVLTARQCNQGVTNESYTFKIIDQTGFFALKIPGPESDLKPISSLTLTCTFFYGQRTDYSRIPILEEMSIEHKPGKVHVIHTRKFRFQDWSGITPIETKTDETGELNEAIIAEFHELYPNYKSLSDFAFIK